MIGVVYIASIGRSGSTLLESMLGAHSQAATAGELHLWPHELRAGGVRPCGCGRPVPECPFWAAVRRRADPLAPAGPGLDHFRESHPHGRTLRPAHLAAFGPAPTAALADRDRIAAYGAHSAAVYEAFADVTAETTGARPEWVVDASKDPYRLAWLARSGAVRLKVVHLVKDPRAFVYSVTKGDIHGEAGRGPSPAPRRLAHTARQAGAWVAQNALVARLRRHVLAPDASLLVRYEALASAPHATFERVCAHVGVPYEAAAVEAFRAGSAHTIAGNPMRYERRGIRLDERWRTGLPASSRAVAEAVAGWAKGRYGYGRRGRATFGP